MNSGMKLSVVLITFCKRIRLLSFYRMTENSFCNNWNIIRRWFCKQSNATSNTSSLTSSVDAGWRIALLLCQWNGGIYCSHPREGWRIQLLCAYQVKFETSHQRKRKGDFQNLATLTDKGAFFIRNFGICYYAVVEESDSFLLALKCEARNIGWYWWCSSSEPRKTSSRYTRYSYFWVIRFLV